MINIFYINIKEMPKNEVLLNMISPKMKEKALKFKRDKNIRQSAVSSLLLNFSLGKNIGDELDFTYNEYGKPFLEDECCFNISHSEDYVVVATGEKTLGVDIEYSAEHDFFRLAKTAFHEKEQGYIKLSKDVKKEFYKIWTLKESFIKAEGKGFSLPIKSFYFSLDENKIRVNANFKTNYNFKILDFPDAYTLSICGTKDEPINEQIKKVTWQDLLSQKNKTAVTKG